MGILARLKTFLAKYFLIIECCHRCGIRQPLVWWCVDDAIWREVTGNEGNGVYCPKCFDRMADKKGIMIRWLATVEARRNVDGKWIMEQATITKNEKG
jgi:hypothetical protein